MYFHFETAALAIDHLIKNGWRQIENGNWVSKDDTCAAMFLTVRGRPEVFCVRFWEI